MNLYLQRHAEPVDGPREDASRGLTAAGVEQANQMAEFLKREIGRVDITITSPFARALETALVMAKALGSHVADTRMLQPEGTPSDMWAEITRLAQQSGEVLVVSHHPSINKLLFWLLGLPEGDEHEIEFKHGSIAMLEVIDLTHPAGRLAWHVTPALVERDQDAAAIVEAATALVLSMEEAPQGIGFPGHVPPPGLRSKGYSYEYIDQKRWVLGDGGAAGNCQECIDNADDGWIDAEEEFSGGVDEPEQHPNCTCTMETRQKRRRVYESARVRESLDREQTVKVRPVSKLEAGGELWHVTPIIDRANIGA